VFRFFLTTNILERGIAVTISISISMTMTITIIIILTITIIFTITITLGVERCGASHSTGYWRWLESIGTSLKPPKHLQTPFG
jgi:uncharacterized membrane protein YhaH (DUF805 family)